jgi:hypothetical protein
MAAVMSNGADHARAAIQDFFDPDWLWPETGSDMEGTERIIYGYA